MPAVRVCVRVHLVRYQRSELGTVFRSTYCEEVLDQHLFARLDDVREATHWRMIDYNEARPRDSLGGPTPVEYRRQHARSSTFDVSA
ncbi:hypothetical protein LUTEI9C_140264 [Luteimonas sp. 9C]|nr:hypothetical protein LUTEI9C_140264 [Luteimonas sp. 9C]